MRTVLLINRDGSLHPTGYVPDRPYGRWPVFWHVAKLRPLRAQVAADAPLQPVVETETVTYQLLAESEPYVIYEEFSR